MEGDVRETVILVHGTFDAPREGMTKWYQPGGSFCKALDNSLAETGSKARCWAHCTSESDAIFSWDGLNDWKSRRDASLALQKYVDRLRKDGWRCHLIGHSHGGNVIIRAFEKAIDHYLDPRERDAWYESPKLGEIVCLGTPFIDLPQFDGTTLNASEEEQRREKTIQAVGSVVFGLMGIALWITRADSDTAYRFVASVAAIFLWLYAAYELFLFLVNVVVSLLPDKARSAKELKTTREIYEKARRTQPDRRTHLLVQNSPHDEARILLRTLEPPNLVLPYSLVRKALWSVYAEAKVFFSDIPRVFNLAIAVAIAALLGSLSSISGTVRIDILAASMAGLAAIAFFSVTRNGRLYRHFLAIVGAIRQVLMAIVLQYIAVPVSYAAARRAIHGLEDYPHRPDVVIGLVPFWLFGNEFYIYEDIPVSAARSGLDRRSIWLDGLMQKLPLVAADGALVVEIFREIMGDPSFVHSTYYLWPENAGRIARFLAERR